MPTGYTAAIAEGITFRDFILSCARAFGACVSMRDDPSDASIPERFEPSDYHTKKIAETERELAELKTMSDTEAEKRAKKLYQELVDSAEKGIRNANALKAKYEAMLSEVRAWVPPSQDHTGLKDFMVQQITESLKFDCSTKYYTDNPPVLQSGSAWRAERLKTLLQDLDYHQREHAEEVSRIESRNTWIRQLRESLPVEKGVKRTTSTNRPRSASR